MHKFMVFDVESIGLHGEGFAVGWVIIQDGQEVGSGRLTCPPAQASGTNLDRKWVDTNIPPIPITHKHPQDIRDEFWLTWCATDCLLVADCPWPVEARFLAACVDDDSSRYWGGPYPLIDVASVRLAVGMEPLATGLRLPNELPIHDPLADARQSARLLMEALASTPAASVRS